MKILNTKLKNQKGSLEFGNINVFVGPNGVGKSTLITELAANAISSKPGTHWISSSKYSDLDQADAKEIIKEIRLRDSQYTLSYLRNDIGEVGSGGNQILNEMEYESLKELARNNKLPEEQDQKLEGRYHELRRNLVGFESTRKRLSLRDPVEAGDAENPTTIYDHLNRENSFVEEISKQFSKIFGYRFDLLKYRQKFLHLGFSNPKNKVSSGTVIEQTEWREKNLIPIDKAGDGMHASATIFFSLFNPTLKIVFIDEPEVFIYPKQKKSIAIAIKELGIKIGQEQGKQIFIVTHDATFLAGLIDNAQEKEDIRLFYIKDRKTIVPLDMKGSEVTPPTKQEKYLQMLFHHATIVSESPNDRYFYETTISEIQKEKIKENDIAFIEVGGASNGAMQIAKLVRNARVKVAFIFDLDTISDPDSGNYKTLKKLFCSISRKTEFLELEALRKLLKDNKKVASYRKSPKGIKDVQWHNEHIASFEKVFDKLKKHGIFVVPHGALESWAGKDAEFPYSAAQKILTNPDTRNFKNFSAEIVDYLLPKTGGTASF